MLEDISIKDFALIDSASLEFMPGFNILTGETGAGKSILIGALSFLLGGKGGVEQVRTGATEARVSGTIVLSPQDAQALDWLSEHAIQVENNRVLLRRFIRDNGKSGAWIQDSPVTRAELAEFSSALVDIHGQHEHQSLMKVSEHRRFLDSYAGIADEVSSFTRLYASLVEKRQLLGEMNSSDSRRQEKIDLLSFSIEEIEKASPVAGEDEELSAEESRLSQYEKLFGDIEQVTQAMHNSDDNLLSLLKKIRSNFDHAADLDVSLAPLATRLESAFYELTDISEEIRSYKQQLVFDPARLEFIQERLALLFKLKKKYASSAQAPVQELLDYAENARTQLEQLKTWDTNKTKLEEELAALERQVYGKAKNLSQKRQSAALQMGQKVVAVLQELGMKGTVFSVGIVTKDSSGDTQNCGPYGFDDIEFLISANPGSPLRPLAKIASGGELSRVMLALKTILADSDTVGTLIFDEIDTGIGGEVAVAVGKHLKNLAAQRQVLCISHLANIAVYADNHIKIEKSVESNTTTTRIFSITGQKREQEIARMLSGETIDDTSLEHARSLLRKYHGR